MTSSKSVGFNSSLVTYHCFSVEAFLFEFFPLVFDFTFEVARQSLYRNAVLSAELTPE